ncbi:MAG TPA: cyclic nucleotide-binding domain-containing protein [Usitatibacter sp.]|nr:cyclic nucleotide-binding domain-containing protein [Usitatibacter sp.]
MSDFDFTKPQPPAPPADFDFTKPPAPDAPPASAPFKAAQSRFYDAAMAEKLFRAAGKAERFAAGQALFTEEKSRGGLFRSAPRMYFLLEGQVALTVGGRPLDTVKPGEVFGEMAVVSERPRSATATAIADCAAISVDRAQLQEAFGRAPEFALMLMSVMFDRLRFLSARMATRKVAPAAVRETTIFEPAMIAQLEQALPRAATVRHWANTVIMREGQSGAFMYVVKSGRVWISIGGIPVEVVIAGGTFGEMAVIDQSPRTAAATTETECELLQLDRPSLLAVIQRQPGFAMAMLRAITDRLRYMNEQLN